MSETPKPSGGYSEIYAALPAYVSDLQNEKLPHSDFFERWTSSDDFKVAYLNYVADGKVDIYAAIAQVYGTVGAVAMQAAQKDGCSEQEAQARGALSGTGFLLSLGLHDIRGETFTLAYIRMCERQVQLMNTLLTQLNTGVVSRDSLMETLKQFSVNASKRPRGLYWSHKKDAPLGPTT